jgi:nucleotide-binding universal stress UspA family protein
VPEGPVLIAYDGSDHAKSAIDQAAALLRPGMDAVVLTVSPPLRTVGFFGVAALPTIPQEILDAALDDARRVAGEGVELATAAGFNAEPLVDEGEPVWDRIVEIAGERAAAVVVIGSHGRSGLSYAAMGSVATSVAHHIKRPVLITRLP